MVTLERMMFETAAREALRYAVSRAITCPCCGGVLDAKAAVLLTHGTDAAIACAACYGRPAGTFRAGAVDVYDGRTLWASRSAKRAPWRFAAA